ncbi:hypothetical protein NHH03_17710 [Stieleria sp. TO1_6]|uniref:hypothetical protein n=1 Tax=Stieleria tagensis TaxID=2956795 RepID=UPI00209B47DE|nr:hypothetical protein [Stieleria tagensis]MCO8123586.1 hypothetical protein [Stieleria tagensis]
MRETHRHAIDEVEMMLVNARLRDELEPYRDESIESSTKRMTLQAENEYLASMLAWERAPALPIADWFSPPMHLLPPDALGDSQLSHRLKQIVDQLYSKNIVLRCTDHLSDRELYTTIYRDILPCCEKMVEVPGKALEWMCVDDTETWLRYYASAVERRRHQEEYDVEMPPAETPKFQRQLPGN